MRSALLLGVLAACSVEKLPPVQMVHRGEGAPAKRVVILPVDCTPVTKVKTSVDPRAWCAAVERLVASELAFRGVEVIDLAKLPATEHTRQIIEVSSTIDGHSEDHRKVTVVGPSYSDVDVWQERDALVALGVDGLVRVSFAEAASWPLRAFALVRITRPADASLIDASVCAVEVSRLDGDVEVIEKTVHCALKGLR